MSKKKSFILWFKDIGIEDVPLVGGKNAALGEMYSNLAPLGINIPNGFALTATAYGCFLEKAGIKNKIKEILKDLNVKNIRDLQKRGRAVRQTILEAQFPKELEKEITKAYEKLSRELKQQIEGAMTRGDREQEKRLREKWYRLFPEIPLEVGLTTTIEAEAKRRALKEVGLPSILKESGTGRKLLHEQIYPAID